MNEFETKVMQHAVRWAEILEQDPVNYAIKEFGMLELTWKDCFADDVKKYQKELNSRDISVLEPSTN